MNSTTSQAWPSLAPEQQKLLLAALASNKKRRSEASARSGSASASAVATNGVNALNGNSASDSSNPNPSLPTNNAPDPFAMTSPPFDLSTSDSAFDVDFGKSLGDFSDPFTALFNDDDDGDQGEQGEKRKSPDEDDDDDDDLSDEKRRDSEPKEAKKPGRKLLTSEPTTKRKAQNRAAQRAFRERKEKHLKDLENKVSDLEKASESANHENSVLRAQVERLQDEVKQYRRRMSLTNGGLNNSPPSGRPSLDGDQSFGSSSLDFSFNFDFPKFGGVPGSVLPSTQAVSKPQQKQSPTALSSYDGTSANGFGNHLSSVSSMSHESSQSNTNQSPFNGPMFGAGFFDPMGGNSTTSPQSVTNNLHGSLTDMNGRPSPGYSSSSSARSPASNNGTTNGPSSSCCTSPDPVDWANIYSGNQSQTKSNDNSSLSRTNTTPGLTNAKTPNSEALSLDFLASQNGGSFDPVLFGDYRDPHNAIVGDDAFSGGFFEEGLSFPDFNDPFNFNLSTDTTHSAPAVSNVGSKNAQQSLHANQRKVDLMAQVDQQREGNYEDESDKNLVMPNSFEDYSKNAPNLMTCNKIWNQLQNCPRFKSGDFDVDTLCSELSAKAKCTETGVAVPKAAVEAALWKLAGSQTDTSSMSAPQQQHKNDRGEDASPKKLDAKAEAARRFEQFMASH